MAFASPWRGSSLDCNATVNTHATQGGSSPGCFVWRFLFDRAIIVDEVLGSAAKNVPPALGLGMVSIGYPPFSAHPPRRATPSGWASLVSRLTALGYGRLGGSRPSIEEQQSHAKALRHMFTGDSFHTLLRDGTVDTATLSR